jgi:hypothetical protein
LLHETKQIGIYRIDLSYFATLEDVMPRDGSIGKETFEQVVALTKKGKSKTEAFAQVASDTGRNPGTVAANYYRVARANGTIKPRRRRKVATSTTPARRQGGQRVASRDGVDIERLTANLVDSATVLADAVKRQGAEIVELRGRLDTVRKALR